VAGKSQVHRWRRRLAVVLEADTGEVVEGHLNWAAAEAQRGRRWQQRPPPPPPVAVRKPVNADEGGDGGRLRPPPPQLPRPPQRLPLMEEGHHELAWESMEGSNFLAAAAAVVARPS